MANRARSVLIWIRWVCDGWLPPYLREAGRSVARELDEDELIGNWTLVGDELLAHLKREQVEPPARDRIRRIIGTALRQAEQAQTARIAYRVPAEAARRMRALIARSADPAHEEDASPGDNGTLFDAAEVAG